MTVVADREGDGAMTLAFELAAIREFAAPATVVAEAREWCRYVGVVANDTEAVAAFVAAHDFRQDFEVGDRDKWLAMEAIRAATDTDRHVFVGTTPEDRRLAEHLGWEFRTPATVAEAAGWELADEDEASLLARLRAYIPSS